MSWVSTITIPFEFLERIERRVKAVNLTMSSRVFNSFKEIPREFFIKEKDIDVAYRDSPLAILDGQTISAPHMYAMMMAKELLDPLPGHSVLEIGAGSGYGAALMGYVVKPGKVYSIERHESLVEYARKNIGKTGLTNVEIIHGDGTIGIPNKKFDRIIVTASGPQLPPTLLDQLKPEGVIVIPIEKNRSQYLWKITLDNKGNPVFERSIGVIFVPLIGKHGFSKK